MTYRIKLLSSSLAIAAGISCSAGSSGSAGRTMTQGIAVAPPTVMQTQSGVAGSAASSTTAASVAGSAAPASNSVQTGAGVSGAPALGATPAASMHMMSSAANGIAGAAGSWSGGTAGAAGATPAAAAGSSSAGTPADAFCDNYGMYCGYGMPNRHADRAACIADFNSNPLQQACKVMHLDTAIAGTAAGCNGMPSAFCFAIHCLHAAGITDPTGVTYCK